MANMQLKQAREGFKRLIYEDVQTIIVYSSSNSPNPWATESEKTIKARISHDRSGPKSDNTTTAGTATRFTPLLSFFYNTVINQGDTLEDESGRKYIMGKTDPLRKFGGVFGNQSELTEVE